VESIKPIFKIGHGPSSSHTIGPGRAAAIFAGWNESVSRFRVTLYGSLALAGHGHGTDRAITKRLPGREVDVVWRPDVTLPLHPNGMVFEALAAAGAPADSWVVYSVGGGDLRDDSGRLREEATLYPHDTFAEILAWCSENDQELWQYVDAFDERAALHEHVADVWAEMQACVHRGLRASLARPAELRRKAGHYHSHAMAGPNSIDPRALLFAYALAVAEENAAGGVVVTAPTCGAAGVLPSVLMVAQEVVGSSEAEIIRALEIAGLVASRMKSGASISGAEVGCQGEIGTACAMAAAAAAFLMGGTPSQQEYAAEMGLEHYLGLTCDPIGGYVQIPCIERNALAADHAWACAVYALYSDGSHDISFDRIVRTVRETGNDIPVEYRETGLGGLAASHQ
jgi:L-serine dehydratase